MKSDPCSPSPLGVPNKACRPLFELGTVGATPGAVDLLDRTGVNSNTYTLRHQRGDFGSVSGADVQANLNAIEHRSRIVSAYTIGGERLWIINEADRSSTTLLLPEEY